MTGYAQSISAYKLIPLMFPLDIYNKKDIPVHNLQNTLGLFPAE
jgi:hypothetical protein